MLPATRPDSPVPSATIMFVPMQRGSQIQRASTMTHAVKGPIKLIEVSYGPLPCCSPSSTSLVVMSLGRPQPLICVRVLLVCGHVYQCECGYPCWWQWGCRWGCGWGWGCVWGLFEWVGRWMRGPVPRGVRVSSCFYVCSSHSRCMWPLSACNSCPPWSISPRTVAR